MIKDKKRKHETLNYRQQRLKGLSLVELILVLTIISVATLAAVGYRYSVTLDTHKAETQINASRLGLMLLEGWKGYGGGTNFAPEIMYSTDFNITVVNTGQVLAHNFTLFNRYKIVFEGDVYYAQLASRNATATEPQMLNVDIAWELNSHDNSESKTRQIKSVKLTTYTG